MKPAPTTEQLNEMLQSTAHPNDKGWQIYRYLKENIGEKLTSAQARSLLLEYTKLAAERPSLLHSMMLGIAIKMAETYPDFKIPVYVSIWGIGNLRIDDYERTTDANGRAFHSLAQRLAACLLRYITTHPDEAIDERTMTLANDQGSQMGFMPIRPMAAVKMFEAENKGRKIRMVKLVGADGAELSTDSRAFHAKPWEIVGRIYQVLPRRAEASGNVRIDTIGHSPLTPDAVLGRVIGYVDRYDAGHHHYHIFDPQSRHFVAEAPKLKLNVGDYVWFAPVVPANDSFKSALVVAVEDKAKGREAFGPVQATVSYVNAEKGYFAYSTPEQERAFGNLKATTRLLSPGEAVNLIIYLRRGADGQKRPYVAEAY